MSLQLIAALDWEDIWDIYFSKTATQVWRQVQFKVQEMLLTINFKSLMWFGRMPDLCGVLHSVDNHWRFGDLVVECSISLKKKRIFYFKASEGQRFWTPSRILLLKEPQCSGQHNKLFLKWGNIHILQSQRGYQSLWGPVAFLARSRVWVLSRSTVRFAGIAALTSVLNNLTLSFFPFLQTVFLALHIYLFVSEKKKKTGVEWLSEAMFACSIW